MPTGFIQGENGALIPVYQPEALDQYMSGGVTQTPAMPPHAQPQNPPAWRQFPPASAYPYIPVSQMTGQTPPHQGSWIPNQAPFMLPAQPSTPGFRGGHPRMGQNGHHHSPSNNRRQRHSTYDRNIPNRPPIRYQPGGHMEQTYDNNHAMPQPAFAGGWNQWTGGR